MSPMQILAVTELQITQVIKKQVIFKEVEGEQVSASTHFRIYFMIYL